MPSKQNSCHHLWCSGPRNPLHHKLKSEMDSTALHFTALIISPVPRWWSLGHKSVRKKRPHVIHFVLIWITPFSHPHEEPSVTRVVCFPLFSGFRVWLKRWTKGVQLSLRLLNPLTVKLQHEKKKGWRLKLAHQPRSRLCGQMFRVSAVNIGAHRSWVMSNKLKSQKNPSARPLFFSPSSLSVST